MAFFPKTVFINAGHLANNIDILSNRQSLTSRKVHKQEAVSDQIIKRYRFAHGAGPPGRLVSRGLNIT